MKYLIFVLVLITVSRGIAATTFAGDADMDGQFDSPDVVTVTNDTQSNGAVWGMARLVTDANLDGELNEKDPERVAEIVVGLSNPVPIAGEPGASAISIWYQAPSITQSTEDDTRLLGVASYWYQPPSIEQATTVDTKVLGSASFWFRPEEITDSTQNDTVTLGASSYWFQPLDLEATDDNTMVLGAPSFEWEE